MVALSGFHVAFSRMALTDASFLLCWVIALICRPAVPGAARRSPAGSCWASPSAWPSGSSTMAGWPGDRRALAACLGWSIDPRERERVEDTRDLGRRPAGRRGGRVRLLAVVRFRRVPRRLRRAAAAPPQLRRGSVILVRALATPARAGDGVLSGGLIWSLSGASLACLVGGLTRPCRLASRPPRSGVRCS